MGGLWAASHSRIRWWSTGTASIGSRFPARAPAPAFPGTDRKSTRLNSSHSQISYAVFCLKKKKQHNHHHLLQYFSFARYTLPRRYRRTHTCVLVVSLTGPEHGARTASTITMLAVYWSTNC